MSVGGTSLTQRPTIAKHTGRLGGVGVSMRGSWYCTTRAMLLILSEASLVHVGGGDGVVVVVVDVVVVHLCVAPPTKKKQYISSKCQFCSKPAN